MQGKMKMAGERRSTLYTYYIYMEGLTKMKMEALTWKAGVD